MNSVFNLIILPRKTMTRDEFLKNTPECSIALDGVVSGGPFFDPKAKHINFDHHDGVIREATMSTCMQVFMAIKGGVMEWFRKDGKPFAQIYINDTDQDTVLAVWLLLHYKLFEGVQSIPHINRLLHLNNYWDITGGAFPINLDEIIVAQHNWIFEPYTNLRKTGTLAQADENVMRDNLDSVLSRLDTYLMNKAGEKSLDTRHEIYFDSPYFKIVNEIGGNEARYYLFSKGMDAFISFIAQRPDGKSVCTIGRRSQFIPFPVNDLYDDFNAAEGLTRANGWNGSDLIGGSSRPLGTGLSWKTMSEIALERIKKNELI